MPWATFDRVIQLYVFDRELRSIALDAIERIEVAIRCRIVYEFCVRHGNNWYEDPSFFKNKQEHKDFLNRCYGEMKRSKEAFMPHYYKKYTNPKHPPAWMALEILSFGQLSMMFKNLYHNEAKKAVALHFGVNYLILESWIEHLTYIRNLCAHHSRLWNRILTIKATIPTNPAYQWVNSPISSPDRVYLTCCIIAYLLKRVAQNAPFTGKLKTLISRNPEIDIKAAGFEINWKGDPFWQNQYVPFTHKVRQFVFEHIPFSRPALR